MPRLDAATRNITIGRLEAGESQNAVAVTYNVHRTNVAQFHAFGDATCSLVLRQIGHVQCARVLQPGRKIVTSDFSICGIGLLLQQKQL